VFTKFTVEMIAPLARAALLILLAISVALAAAAASIFLPYALFGFTGNLLILSALPIFGVLLPVCGGVAALVKDEVKYLLGNIQSR
jgi:hypothetical protein